MPDLVGETRAHMARKQEMESWSRQMAALQLLCGIDLERLACGGAAEQAAAFGRIERALKRERLKGSQRHWSYDLNRHIALKQARDRLRKLLDGDGESQVGSATRPDKTQ